jgi:hypothetical protein
MSPPQRIIAAVIGTWLVAATGCGETSSETVAGRAGAEDVTFESLGRCAEGTTPGDPRPSARGLVADTAEWLQVDVNASDLATAAAREGTVDRPLRVAPVRAADGAPFAVGSAEERDVRLHHSFLEGLEWAAAHPGATAYLAVGDEANYGSQVLFGVVVSPDGRVAFTGTCARQTMLEPLAAGGGDVGALVQSWIGLTGEELVAATGTEADAPATNSPVILAPSQVYDRNAPGGVQVGGTPPGMSLISVTIDAPDDWSAPATVCTKAPQGWNDCLPLDGSVSLPATVTAFVDSSGSLEVWLLDENALVTEPHQMLGTITVPEHVRTTGGSVSVTISGSLRADGTRVEAAGLVQQ